MTGSPSLSRAFWGYHGTMKDCCSERDLFEEGNNYLDLESMYVSLLVCHLASCLVCLENMKVSQERLVEKGRVWKSSVMRFIPS